MASTLAIARSGAVGFIDWLGPRLIAEYGSKKERDEGTKTVSRRLSLIRGFRIRNFAMWFE